MSREPERTATPLLDRIGTPRDLWNLSIEQLQHLANELRTETIDVVSQTGGHLGSSLAAVELTVALHAVLHTPHDRLIWDVGHQAYPHKILTGRRNRMRTIRQRDGLAGFTSRSESEYDPFGAGHSSTSISAGLGMAVARDLLAAEGSGKDRTIVCVIGDGAMSAGMAYEAMNNAGAMKARMIVILNDNEMSIAPPTGAMSGYLSRLISSRQFLTFRDLGLKLAGQISSHLERGIRRTEELARSLMTGSTLFDELGFYYVGPVDGHDLHQLIPLLRHVREAELIHMVRTARQIDDRPSAIRYPRGPGTGALQPARAEALTIGRGRILREGTSAAILSLGTRLADALEAARVLEGLGLSVTVADARFAKPLDVELITRLARHHPILVTVEEGAAGGFGAAVMHCLTWEGLMDRGLVFRAMTLPDRFIDHDSQEGQITTAKLTAADIVETIRHCLEKLSGRSDKRI
ncbi:1-deoxy-D-xylulose-5-phosphate synthase N-terminal domain-containing protein [Rhizobium sp. BR 314]|uniref:1-deoxy-D-xylulose-5-phosphate synthase N-terminal domain-containing protein n=1 Tax=Rhizobium sp. BR 314 TaxID=3040013 RepID=UPI0039BF24A3